MIDNKINQYFKQQASVVIEAINAGQVDVDSLAISLKITWALGVMDAERLDTNQKKEIYQALKEMYPELAKREH